MTGSDADSDPITYLLVANPTNGTLSGSGTDYTYSPNTGFTGSDSFTFKVNDGAEDSDIVTVDIAVNSTANTKPVAVAQSVSINQDTDLPITLSGSDADSDPLTYILVTNPSSGSLSGSGTDYTYSPNTDFTGSDLFTFKVNDGTEDSDIASVNITVNSTANTQPIADAQSVNTNQDTDLPITLTGSDADNDPITYLLVANPTNGNLSGSGADYTYTPNSGYTGSDSFTFKVNDGTEDSDIVTVDITVNSTANAKPVADAQSVNTNQDTALAITLSGSDADSEPLTYIIETTSTNGNLSGSGANYTYTPNSGYTGSDSFTFKVNDGTEDSDIVTVSITVSDPTYTPPIAVDGSYETLINTDVAIHLEATNYGSSTVHFSIDSSPANGILSGSGYDYVYTPNLGFSGTDTFTFKASANGLVSQSATVSINVLTHTGICKMHPFTFPYSLVENSSIGAQFIKVMEGIESNNYYWADWSGSAGSWYLLYALGVEGNSDEYVNANDASDTFLNRGDWLWQLKTLPSSGSYDLKIKALVGKDLIVPAWSQIAVNDIDSTRNVYQISEYIKIRLDEVKNKGQKYISFTYNGLADCDNTPPTALDQNVTIDEDSPVELTLGVSDVESNEVGIRTTILPANGTLTKITDGYIYSPHADFFGQDSFSFKAFDGIEFSNEATVTIDILPVEDAPKVIPISVPSGYIGLSFNYILHAVDEDITSLTYELLQSPVGMTISSLGEIYWLPDTSDEGEVLVEVLITDINGLTTIYSFTITVSHSDFDNDGIIDSLDLCLSTYEYETIDTNGCSAAQLDNLRRKRASTLPKTGADVISQDYSDAYVRAGTDRRYTRDDVYEVVTDNVNQLIWQDNGDAKSLRLSWDDANSYCESSTLAGITDWKLPSKFQLLYLLNMSQNIPSGSPKIDTVFLNTSTNTNDGYGYGDYWTDDVDSVTLADYSVIQVADFIDFESARIIDSHRAGNISHQILNVRCVSGAEKFIPELASSNGVLRDSNHNLMWKFNSEVYTLQFGFTDAIAHCENLTLANANDWRLPNINELHSVVMSSNYNLFGQLPYGWLFWTSTTLQSGSSGYKLGVDDEGYIDYGTGTSFVYALCVRDYTPPVVNSGGDRTALYGEELIFDASNSYATDGSIVSYSWWDLGRGEPISSDQTFSITDTPIGVNSYQLSVIDDKGTRSVELFTVTVSPNPNDTPPVADAGSDQTIAYVVGSNGTINLNAINSSDDKEIVKYEWYENGVLLETLTGEIWGNNTYIWPLWPQAHSVDITIRDDVDSTYVYTLKVYDGNGSVTSTDVNVTVMVVAPLKAEAGENLTVSGGELITLDGSNSTSGLGDIIERHWIMNSRPASALYQQFDSTEQIEFTLSTEGVYEIKYWIRDENNNTSSDTLLITVTSGYSLSQCNVDPIGNDDNYIDNPPDINVEWVGSNFTDVAEIEKAFFTARLNDNSVEKFLKMPVQATWDSWTPQQKGLYLVNSEREARGIKPFDGISSEAVEVASQFADYSITTSNQPSHYRGQTSIAGRLNENITIRDNCDNCVEPMGEGLFVKYQSTDEYPSESEAIVEAVYHWLYMDKYSYWFGRDHLFQTSLNENNSNSLNQEGLLGFGVAMGFKPIYQLDYAVIVIANSFDPASTWDHTNTITVDTSNSHNCNKLTLSVSEQAPSLDGLSSLVISLDHVVLKPQTTQTIQIIGHYSDGSTQDLTEYVSFSGSGNSVVSLSSGLITALNIGSVKINVSANGIDSNIMAVHVANNIEPPIANAGEDKSVAYISSREYTLDGSASSDDVGIVKYQWKLNDNVVSESAIYNFSVRTMNNGIHEYFLTVTDETGFTATDSVLITIRPVESPIANAGSDQSVRVGSTVIFDGSASTYDTDYDVDLITYEWKLDGTLLSTERTFSYDQLSEGVWTVELTILYEGGAQSFDSVVITVLPELTMQTCTVGNIESDTNFVDIFPEENIAWIGANSTDVTEIEKAFNHARVIDSSTFSYLKMPSQAVWDSWTTQQQGLFIINSERQARNLKPFTGVSAEVVEVASQYADYLRVNNEVITHYRSSDGASQTDRLNENTVIANNSDNIHLEESIYSFPLAAPSESAAVINAIYATIYQDKNPLFGYAWGHREHQLQTGLYENSGDIYHEGLLGFGVSMGDYNPYNTDPSAQGYIVVINTIDPSASWDYSSVVTVDTSTANACNSEVTVTIDDQSAPVTNLQSLLISPNDINLNPFDSQVLKVSGIYSDGSSQDLTSYVNFIPDERSIVSIDSGIVYALNTGIVNISASVNGVTSNTISITVASETDTSNLSGTYAEQYLQYLPSNASISHYDPKAFSLFNGKVTDINGTPLSGVIVSFHSLPGENNGQYGSVTTNADGLFTLAGQAGKRTLVYSKDGYLTIHRTTISASNSWTTLDEVALLEVDSKKTFIDLTSNTAQIHRSTIITDGFGERATTLVFNNINSVTVTDKVGNTRQLNDFFVQATEYQTPNSMPADLPDETAFTYCSELQIAGVGDEESVVFDSNVVMYVDNFLGFAVGEIVPIGYYDRAVEEWKSSENGVVVKLLDSNSDGLVDGLDYTGDDIADDMNNNGNTTDEVAGIESYTPGETYWRGSFNHFTPVDYNWSAINDGNKPNNPNAKNGEQDPNDYEKECVSSYIKPKELTLHEDINVTGTGLTLHYSSQRTHGYHHKISANVSGADIPFGVLEMIAVLEIGGNRFEQTFTATTYQDVEFVWDGTDPTGALVQGTVRGRLSIGYKYQSEYQSAGNVATSGQALTSFPTAWAQWGASPTGIIGREDDVLWSNAVVTVLNAPTSNIANGWSLSNHHMNSPFDMVYLGNGEAVEVDNSTNILKTGITESQYIGDDGYYQKGGLDIDYSVDDSGVLTDKATGIQWQYFSGNAPQFAYKTEASAYCNNLSLGSQNLRWRLPTYKEIIYSIDKSGAPHELLIYQIDAISLWNQSSLSTNNQLQSVVCVSSDTINVYQDSLDHISVQGLQRNAIDEVVIDEQNSLMWQDTIDNNSLKHTWTEAIDYCEALDHANYSDWRLPNINELAYALPNEHFVNETTFVTFPWYPFNEGNQPYWTSTPNAGNPAQEAWAMESYGLTYEGYSKDSLFNTRCVRDDLTRQRSPYVFDATGKHIKTIDINSGITLTTFNYDSEGRLINLKDQFDNTITINRDVDGKATEIVSPDGYITTLTVDAFNDLTRAEYDNGSAYDFVYQDSLMLEETDVRNNVFTRSFDSTGRILQSLDPEGGQWNFFSSKDEFTKVTRYGFTTAEGNMYESLLSFLENGDQETVTTYKDLSQLTRTQQNDDLKESYQSSGVLTVIDNVIDVKTKQEIPNIITTSLPSGLTSIIQLDKTYAENGTDTSKTTITLTNNTKVSTLVTDTVAGTGFSSSAQSRTSSTTYNPLTQQVTSQQITGLTASDYQYDSRGRLSTITSGDRITTYTYDDVASKGGLTSVSDAMEQSTAFDYDSMGRLIQTTYHDGSVLSQSYDNNGNLASITPPNQPTHYFNYNSVDKETDYTPPVVAGVANPSTVYDYDRDRKLTTITRPDAQLLTFNYTVNTDQLTSLVIPRGTYNYAYDAFANITKITAPDTDELSFTYDGNLPLSQTWTGTVAGSVSQTYNTDFIVNQQCINGANCIDYLYDLDNLITTAGDLTISRETQKAGLINGSTLDNITMVRTNDSFGEMSDEISKFNTATLLSANYLRDKLGRITERTLDIQGASSTDIYAYNDAGRLASVTNGSVMTSYVFDDNGNRLSKTIDDGVTPIVTSGVYDEQDRLTSYGDCTYQYTANGELQQKTCGTDITQYSYDVLGNLMQVTLPDNTKIDYLIDGLNRRVSKKVNDTLQQGFLYGDQLNPVAELDSSNNIVSQFVYGTKVNVPDYMIKGGITYKIITDQLGSPRLVVNASTGVVAQRMDYDEFGVITQDTNPNFQPFGFAGGLVDNQTGLTRFGARDYDAHTGRWTSKDPIRFSGGDSNIYGYVFSDPINFIDPSGKILFNIVSAAFGAVINGYAAINSPNATFGSIMKSIAIGAATGAIGVNPANYTIIRGLIVMAVNGLGDYAQQLNLGTDNLDHSRALLAAMLGISYIPEAVKKELGEAVHYGSEYGRQRIISAILDWESRCKK